MPVPDPGSPAAALKRRQLYSGLDLGKTADYSTFVTVERFKLDRRVAKRRFRYELAWLDAWELGTRYSPSYPGEKSVIGDVAALYAREGSPLARTALAVDYTGVGNAVYEQIVAARFPARLSPILITSGHTIMRPDETKDRSYHVPKVEIVGVLTVLLEAGLLKWTAPGERGALQYVERLEAELTAFKEFVTKKKNATFGAESSAHDDFVLALGLAVWLAENSGGGSPEDIASGSAAEAEVGVLSSMPAGVSPTGRSLKRFP